MHLGKQFPSHSKPKKPGGQGSSQVSPKYLLLHSEIPIVYTKSCKLYKLEIKKPTPHYYENENKYVVSHWIKFDVSILLFDSGLNIVNVAEPRTSSFYEFVKTVCTPDFHTVQFKC